MMNIVKAGFAVNPSNNMQEVRWQLAHKYPVAAYLPLWVVEAVLPHIPDQHLHMGTSDVITSAMGQRIVMEFQGVPLSPAYMECHPALARRRIVNACGVCQKRGAAYVGLGGHTTRYSNYGQSLVDNPRITMKITTGNSLTAFSAVEATLALAQQVGYENRRDCVATVIGAGGSIGSAIAAVLVEKGLQVLLVGKGDLTALRARIGWNRCIQTSLEIALPTSHIIFTVTGGDALPIEPAALVAGTIICDVARPRNVEERVARERPDDVLVIEGGLYEVPGKPNLGLQTGLPRGLALACMVETMAMAMEQWSDHYTIGKELSKEQIQAAGEMANRHGFRFAGYRSFDGELLPEKIARFTKVVKAAR